MGLRFRKTISILPGVRLNLGKSTASVSVGVPGFRKTFNTKGQVTTTVGLPGTGLYYVDTKNPKKEAARRQQAQEARNSIPAQAPAPAPVPASKPMPQQYRRPIQTTRSAPTSAENFYSIHKSVDDTIDWNEILASPTPPDSSYNAEMWSYYHSVAPAIMNGDIDAYLNLIYEVNPLDDLLAYGSGFTFGTDDAAKMEVEFSVNESALFSLKASVNRAEYNEILQDFVCSTAIRVARDIFALLPVENAIVHAELRSETILSAAFDRGTMSRIRFGLIDPSDTMERFKYNMDFTLESGFRPVDRLE